jgi:DNA-binding Xre family transcriptional regulator
MTTVPEETFVIELSAQRTHSLRIAGRRIRSQKALKAIFLEERGARRPSVFVSSTATQLAALADVAHEERGNLRLFLFEDVSPGRKEFLQTLFRTVVSVGGDVSLLDSTELVEVLVADNRSDLFIGGTVNPVDEVVVLYRGSLDRLAVPFTWFTRVSDVAIDFADFGVADHGHTLRFGEFEVAADAILYDFDPAYRARAKKRQLRLDESFGGSLRRLRELRGVLRSDFGSISEKTLARIERGEVEQPRERTLNAIARRLDVSPEELETY